MVIKAERDREIGYRAAWGLNSCTSPLVTTEYPVPLGPATVCPHLHPSTKKIHPSLLAQLSVYIQWICITDSCWCWISCIIHWHDSGIEELLTDALLPLEVQ